MALILLSISCCAICKDYEGFGDRMQPEGQEGKSCSTTRVEGRSTLSHGNQDRLNSKI